MMARPALAACGLAALLLPAAAPAALEVRLILKPASPQAGEQAVIHLRTYAPFKRRDGSCCRLLRADPRGYPFRVEAVSPRGGTSRVRVSRTRPGLWRGAFRFDADGRWDLRVANYGPRYRHAPGARPRLTVLVRRALPKPLPGGFGFLGRPGCDPPSARNSLGQSFPALGEVFGTATGGQVWALFFSSSWASADTAVLEGVAGKEVKIVFRMTGLGWFEVEAVGPDGNRRAPVSGPTHHPSSTWTRPGDEWGTQFVFDQTGCWRIQARRADLVGDVWLLVRS